MHINTPQSLKIPAGDDTLTGDLHLLTNAKGIVLFVHGSGSSRFSPRNRAVAQAINKVGIATLLFDLLTPMEEAVDVQTAQYRFDIPLLAKRLVAVTDWLQQQKALKHLNIGYFGSSTGAGAALIAAAERPDVIKTIVSRGGRPDLAGDALASVKTPTLLIVGGLDTTVIALNRQAQKELRHADSRLEIIPGATHLFEEPGKLDAVTALACQWFKKYLS
jgi:dienelactone hydrolase